MSALEIPRINAETMIEHTVAELLPQAARSFWLPTNTPLRWHESYIQRVADPFSFALWVALDPEKTRTISITRALPVKGKAEDRKWGCVITEPTPPEDEEADYSETCALVSAKGLVTVEKIRRQKDPTNPKHVGMCVGGEWATTMSEARKSGLLEHMNGILQLAIQQTPGDQAAFFAKTRHNSSTLSFEKCGSAASKEALKDILGSTA